MPVCSQWARAASGLSTRVAQPFKTARWVCDVYNADSADRHKLKFEEVVKELMKVAQAQLRPEAYKRLETLYGQAPASQPAGK